MRALLSLLVTSLLLSSSSALSAQEASDVLAGLRNGGGWVSVPIANGVGTVSTARMPTVGMTLTGCLNVWPGHSGAFEIRAHDQIADSSLVVQALPGVGVPFSHTFGRQAQIDFDFRWSEPRDTTLLLWVGLAIGKSPQDACEPVYGG
jgi:hypothetical protein